MADLPESLTRLRSVSAGFGDCRHRRQQRILRADFPSKRLAEDPLLEAMLASRFAAIASAQLDRLDWLKTQLGMGRVRFIALKSCRLISRCAMAGYRSEMRAEEKAITLQKGDQIALYLARVNIVGPGAPQGLQWVWWPGLHRRKAFLDRAIHYLERRDILRLQV